MAHERKIAGMTCGDVLAELSDYLDGDLIPERRDQILAHLQGCDVCERFGGVFTAAIRSLRVRGTGVDPEGDAAFERLRARLAQTLRRERQP